MKNGRILKYCKDFLRVAKYGVIKKLPYPDGPLYSVHASLDGNYEFGLYSGQGLIIFETENEAVNFFKRHRGKDLKDPNHPFRIGLETVSFDEPI